MALRNRKMALLLILPLFLFAAIYYLTAPRRPSLLPGVAGIVTDIAFSPDGQTIVCASSNGLKQQWMPRLGMWRSFRRDTSPGSYMRSPGLRLRFSPDGRILYAGGCGRPGDTVASIAWDVSTRRREFSFNIVQGPGFDVSPDGRWVALTNSNSMYYANSVYLVDLEGKALSFTGSNGSDYLKSPQQRIFSASIPAQVTCVAFSPDSQTLAVGGGNKGEIYLCDLRTKKSRQLNQTLPSSFGQEIVSLAWSPDGKRLATLDSSQIAIFRVDTRKVLKASWPSATAPMAYSFRPENNAPLAWTPDGEYLFSGGDAVRQWRTSDLTVTRSYDVTGPVAVSPDGKTLATANRYDQATGVALWVNR